MMPVHVTVKNHVFQYSNHQEITKRVPESYDRNYLRYHQYDPVGKATPTGNIDAIVILFFVGS